uniref:GRF-type domain-containing protein n=1 Tax=Erpetoichthys calabaricus TaxID=27687 RepID=A0A8C4X9E6_ERPCA
MKIAERLLIGHETQILFYFIFLADILPMSNLTNKIVIKLIHFLYYGVNVGDDLESDRYLITVEEAKATGNQVPCPSLKASQQNGSHLNPPLSARQYLPVGLKRKHSGYRVPQQIQKKATTEENKLSSAQLHQCISNSSHSPKLYNQSPLFATITNKQTTTITRGVDHTIGTHLDVPLTDQIVQASSSSASSDLPTPSSCVEPSFPPGLQESTEYVTDKEQNLKLPQDLPTFGHFNSVSSASKNIRNTAEILALLGSDKSQKDALPKCDTTSVIKSFKANPFIDQKSSHLFQNSKSVQPKELSFSLSHSSSAIFPKDNLSNNISFDYSVQREKTVLEDLAFPSGAMVSDVDLPKRQIHIPTSFQSCTHYKHVFAAALTEHLNILLFDLAQKLHKALSKVDISPYTAEKTSDSNKKGPVVPLCHHKEPAQLAIVKKCGQNQGRFYYTCNASNLEKCNFFKWLDDVNAFSMQECNASSAKMVMSDVPSISTYIRSQHIPLYSQCHLLIRKSFDFQRKRFHMGKSNYNNESLEDAKPKLYLKLSRKESSSSYSKDDLWVVSKTLLFDPHDTFIACSAFFGPSSTNELEIVPIKGYHPSNWLSDAIVHALLVCNASTELTTLRNLQENFLPASMPLLPYLLKIQEPTMDGEEDPNRKRGGFIPPAARMLREPKLQYTGRTVEMASQMIDFYHLNGDQAAALFRVAKMMGSNEKSESASIQDQLPITIIHGVFGAGKSFLLAVIVLFLVHLFAETEQAGCPNSTRWKLLISSSTNVSVDRVLLSLLDLGFDKFIRVGSVRKIAKRVLPHSLHAGSESEQLRELQSLLKMNLSSVEKIYVRKSIEQHKLGRNKALLREVQVVGATCAACPFPCMNNLLFPVVLLDECSQITEPASMLPIARFGCEKLVLVGDPKQLPPTIQGSEATHSFGIEQTLFDRMCLMGHEPVLLRSQYRCHPAISKLANELFYSGALVDGIAESDRRPLVDWLPTLCFCSVAGTEQIEKDGSFHNIKEALFTLKLIQTLIAAGIEGTLIGVITLYKSQMNKICSLIYSNTCCNHREVKLVQVSTVDAFQGAEKEIIILSSVRTRHVGFTDSERRMNVALTRGKRHLLILGNLACLQKNVLWRRVISHCQGTVDVNIFASREPAPNYHLQALAKGVQKKGGSQKKHQK